MYGRVREIVVLVSKHPLILVLNATTEQEDIIPGIREGGFRISTGIENESTGL